MKISHDTSLRIARISAIVGLGVFLAGTLTMIPLSRASQTVQDIFDSHLHKKRLLLVFYERGDGEEFRRQMDVIAQAQKDFDERDVFVMPISPVSEGSELLQNRYNSLRKPFMAVLIGKDGGMKMKSEHALTLEAINGTIDSWLIHQAQGGRGSSSEPSDSLGATGSMGSG